MALAFFGAPALPSLLGFGKAASTPDESKARPESMSAEAIIKCSDCGGDVVLAQLGEHICQPSGQLPSIPEDEQVEPDTQNILPKPPELDKTSKTDLVKQPSQDTPAHPTPPSSQSTASIAQPTSSSGPSLVSSSRASTTSSSSVSTASTSQSSPPTSNQSSTSTSSLESLKEKLLNSIRPDLKPASSPSSSSNSATMGQKSKLTSSSENSFSNSDTSSTSNSSSGRVPFFERYAQLMPKTTNDQPKTLAREAEQEKDKVNSARKKPLSPITSPEPSPLHSSYQSTQTSQPKISSSKSMPFSDFSALGIASQRREALTRNTKDAPKLPSSNSAASGLDRLIAREQEELSRSGRDHGPRNLRGAPMESRGRVGTEKSSSIKARKNEPSMTGLEDLMGDLMAEMEKKAELSSEKYQKRTRQPAPRKIIVPEATPKNSSLDRFAQDPDEVDTPRKYPAAYPDDTPKFHTRQPSDSSNHSATPSSPGIRPSDSISQLGYTRSPSPKLTKALRAPRGESGKMCERCMEMPIRYVRNSKSDEGRFCSACYADLYLPKCRKCSKAIERGAVTDRVGKVLGKYHASCFNCFQCNAPFPNGEFYVWERRPVCSKHYHRLAGTTCCHESCGRGIEGPCVSLFLDGSQTGSVVSDDSSGSNPVSNSARRKLYHPEHFSCSYRGCPTSLNEFHFVVNKQPWCERHALQEEDGLPRAFGLAQHHPSREPRLAQPDYRMMPSRLPSDPRAAVAQPPRRMERRRTIIQNVRNR